MLASHMSQGPLRPPAASPRPWRERPVFGNVRYMNASGLERKFDMAAYVARVRHAAPASV